MHSHFFNLHLYRPKLCKKRDFHRENHSKSLTFYSMCGFFCKNRNVAPYDGAERRKLLPFGRYVVVTG
ncbi:hypothetical protein HMPREF0262_01965 [Clostridium sp. ATCC 29733]|nr:hypothetical protein HMPREF0262_01965 [Clostridium sp. ATCC 29733]